MAIGTTRHATPSNTLQVKEKMEHLASKRKNDVRKKKRKYLSRRLLSYQGCCQRAFSVGDGQATWRERALVVGLVQATLMVVVYRWWPSVLLLVHCQGCFADGDFLAVGVD
jgi:hypothetical protein